MWYHFGCEGCGRDFWQPTAHGFHGSADVIDQLSSCADEALACSELGQVSLRLGTAVADWSQEFGI
jgi:hypothetical protein